MLEKNGDVIAAYPHGDTGEVHIHASKSGVFTRGSVAKLIEKKREFKVKSFSTRVVAKAKTDSRPSGKQQRARRPKGD